MSEIFPETPGVPGDVPESVLRDRHVGAEFTRWRQAQVYTDPLGILAEAFAAGFASAEETVTGLRASEDAPGSEPEPAGRYALVEMTDFRRVIGTVAETQFCGRPMLEVLSLETNAVQLVGPESIYALTWMTKDQAERATRTGAHSRAAIAAADAEEFAEADGDPWGPPPFAPLTEAERALDAEGSEL